MELTWELLQKGGLGMALMYAIWAIANGKVVTGGQYKDMRDGWQARYDEMQGQWKERLNELREDRDYHRDRAWIGTEQAELSTSELERRASPRVGHHD